MNSIKFSAHPLRHQKGFSLVELMVSLTIGLVVILFVTSLYVGSKSSSRLQDDNTRMQEDGRAAMNLIGSNIKQAWFGEPRGYSLFGVVSDFQGRGLIACDNGFAAPTDFANEACAAGGSGQPSLQLSYKVNGVSNLTLGIGTDCNGQTVPADATGVPVVINRFYLVKKSGEAPSLYCAGNGNAVPQPVLQNVENLVFTYGIDENNDAYSSPDFFTTSAATALLKSPASPGFPATGFPAFKKVITVGVCMQLVSNNQVTQGNQTYTDCNGTVQTGTDHKFRLILQNTFVLRNNSAATVRDVEART